MRLSKSAYIPILLTCLTVASFAGSSLGTLAWYAYSTRAKIEMGGTAVQSTQQLQIGLYCTDYDTNATKRSAYQQFGAVDNAFGTTLETVGSGHYIWMPAGQGFSETAINTYLTINGCATNSLTPTTTRPFDRDDPIHTRLDDKGTGDTSDDEYVSCGIGEGNIELYDSLTAGDAVNTYKARPGSYIELPIVFRVIAYEGLTPSYASGSEVWVTDITSSSLDPEHKNADKAIRVHVHNPNGASDKKDFLINPADREDDKDDKALTDEFTYVAGCLNLRNDDFYDTDNTDKEILYGDFEAGTVVSKDYAASTDLNDAESNINRVAGDSFTEASTFLAKHKAGTRGYAAYKDAEGHDLRKKAFYYTLADIAPDVDSQGDYSGGYPVAKTVTSVTPAERIGRADLTIWLEGWDHAIIDANVATYFNLGLTFEINRV